MTAAPIWKQFMSEAIKGTAAEQFPIPDGIQNIIVDALSGSFQVYTTATKTEIFASFSVPKEYDDLHLANGVTTLHLKDQTPFLGTTCC